MTTDKATYRHCAEPHESIEKANEAATNFYKAVEAARKEFRMESVVVIVRMNIMHEDDEVQATTHALYGDMGSACDMLAYTFGQEKASRDAATMAMISKGKKQEEDRPSRR